MRVSLIDLDRDQIQLAVADAALGHHGVGELPTAAVGPRRKTPSEAVLVVEMGVHGRHRQVVVIVLDRSQPLGQLAFMMIEDIRQVGDAVRRFIARQAPGLDLAADDVAHGLRAITVAALGNQRIEMPRRLMIKEMVNRSMSAS